MNYLFMCRSLTYAQRSSKILERKGVTGTVIKAPREAAVNGCSYCVRVQARSKERAMEALRDADLMPERVFLQEGDTLREVTT